MRRHKNSRKKKCAPSVLRCGRRRTLTFPLGWPWIALPPPPPPELNRRGERMRTTEHKTKLRHKKQERKKYAHSVCRFGRRGGSFVWPRIAFPLRCRGCPHALGRPWMPSRHRRGRPPCRPPLPLCRLVRSAGGQPPAARTGVTGHRRRPPPGTASLAGEQGGQRGQGRCGPTIYLTVINIIYLPLYLLPYLLVP